MRCHYIESQFNIENQLINLIFNSLSLYQIPTTTQSLSDRSTTPSRSSWLSYLGYTSLQSNEEEEDEMTGAEGRGGVRPGESNVDLDLLVGGSE